MTEIEQISNSLKETKKELGDFQFNEFGRNNAINQKLVALESGFETVKKDVKYLYETRAKQMEVINKLLELAKNHKHTAPITQQAKTPQTKFSFLEFFRLKK
jgi:hypothetical protein